MVKAKQSETEAITGLSYSNTVDQWLSQKWTWDEASPATGKINQF